MHAELDERRKEGSKKGSKEGRFEDRNKDSKEGMEGRFKRWKDGSK